MVGVKLKMPYSSLMPRLVDCTARIASGLARRLREDECGSLPKLAYEAVKLVGERLVQEGPPIYCPICMKGPYTRKGYYLHLVRVHGDIIRESLLSEIRRLEGVYRGQLG